MNRGVDQFNGVENRPVVPDTSGRRGDLQHAARGWPWQSYPATAAAMWRTFARRAGRPAPAGPGCRCRRCRSRCPLRPGSAARCPGSPCSSARGCGAHALPVRQMTGVVIDHARRQRTPVARGSPSSTSSSDTSRTLRAERRRARSAQAGSSANSSPYSFIADPQPAALTAMRSTPAFSKTSMLCRASARAWSMRPACSASAPQQPWPAGACTPQPSAASTRTVAWLTCANDSRCTQPVSSATFSRSDPTAGVCSGIASMSDRHVTGGARAMAAVTRCQSPPSVASGRLASRRLLDAGRSAAATGRRPAAAASPVACATDTERGP